MKRLLNKYFPLKLKTRVKHYVWGRYCIQYSHYRFIPIFHTLCKWSDTHEDNDLGGFVPLISDYHGAIRWAKDFDTYDKIKAQNKRASEGSRKYRTPKTYPSVVNVRKILESE